jgi:cysteinyl-tRNA synthetase
VYDYIHLGHARTFIAFDIITRYLAFLGYGVRYIINITDVADRLIERAQQSKRDPLELAREYERAFLEDMRALGIVSVERYERASDYIPQILTQIKGLMYNGVAYQTETGVYFEVKKFPKFGQLSGLSREELGLRRLELCSSKLNPEDFSLWRRHDTGLRWQSPWGEGRPGWHVEDTAISMTHFGDTYDIHGGAAELVFPHHEAEIAQAEALTGKTPFVRFWLHAGLLAIKGRKMSKSLGNVIHVRDALKQYTAAELRYYFASFHYRDQINISESALKRASTRLKRLQDNFRAFENNLPTSDTIKETKLPSLMRSAQLQFKKYMDDDFDTPRALAVLTDLSRNLAKISEKNVGSNSKESAERAFRSMAHVFGILP